MKKKICGRGVIVHKRAVLYAVLCSLLFCSLVNADEIYLKNGDKITGEVIEEKKTKIILKTHAMGEVVVLKDDIERISRKDIKHEEESSSSAIDGSSTGTIEKKESPKIEWKRQVSAGYNASQGNTKEEKMFAEVLFNRKIKSVDEVTVKGKVYYSEADKKMETQQWYGMGRYAFSFGENKKWYNFYRIEADHDRFASINYRVIPVAGVGLWIIKSEDIKLLTELGIGLEHTNFTDETKETDEPILAPRLFYEHVIFKNVTFTENLYAYPSLGEFGEYRLRSETSVAMRINKTLSVKIGIEDEYNSNPSLDVKNNDLRVITSLAADF
ncbi:MAG: DUF481 domain-containing protein [Candidatus Aadella gelida]|nr:DUF481 domain-containing protein [Candidatus Aadella gelida]